MSNLQHTHEGTRQVTIAETIARIAHAHAEDKAGHPYIDHPARVVRTVDSMSGTYDQIAVAWLHDVIEDTDFTLDDLRKVGVSEDILRGVNLLTRWPGVPPESYYQEIRDSDFLIVKAADILDNLEPRRLALLDDDTVVRLTKKYAKALDALGLDGNPIEWTF